MSGLWEWGGRGVPARAGPDGGAGRREALLSPLRDHPHSPLRQAPNVLPCSGQYLAGTTAKNLLYLPGSDRCLSWQPDADALGLVVVVEIEDKVAQELRMTCTPAR